MNRAALRRASRRSGSLRCSASRSRSAPGRRAATPIVADLSSHLIAITSGFTGTSVVLFGATDGPGDIIAVVRGPEREMTVWRKGKIAGIWVNAEAVTFANVPSFYAVAASRPLDEALLPGAAALYRIGTANLKLESRQPMPRERAKRFAEALIAEQERAGLMRAEIGKIAFLGDRLFRAVDRLSRQCADRHLSGRGVPGARPRCRRRADNAAAASKRSASTPRCSISRAAQAAAYGAIAVLTAVVAGWLASLPFRGS